MHSVGYILISSLLVCVTTINAHQPIDHDFINIFDANDTDDVNYRLPNNTKPEHYAISLTTNVHENNFTFEGKVIIILRALEPTRNITIHHRQLRIDKVHLLDVGTSIPIVVHWKYDTTTEFIVITVADELKKNQLYQLVITYYGDLRDDMGGFYRSSYVNSKNETRFACTLHN